MGPGGPMGGPPMGPPPGGMPPRHGAFPGMPKPPQKPVDDYSDKEFDLKQMEKESEEMVRLVTLNRTNSHFQKTTGAELQLEYAGHIYRHTELIETFPFTDRYSFISVRDADDRSREIGMIEALERDFDESDIRLIKEHLKLRYHMPVIRHFIQVKESGGFTHFTVMTDCGEAQFSLKANGSHITALDEKRLIIQDTEGNRFDIPDRHLLSAKELKRLDVFM